MNRLNRFLKSTAGFSMTELMVGAGLAGAAALGVASLMGSIGGNESDAELIVEKTQFASSLGVYLNSAFGCNDMKAATLSASDQELSLNEWKFRGVPVWKNETQFSDKLKNKLFLKTLSAKLDVATISPTTSTLTLSYLNGGGAVTETLTKSILKVTAVLEMNKREYPHEFQIPVLQIGGQLRFCGDNQTLASTCASLEGVFDPLTGECRLKEACQTMGSYSIVTCSPKVNGTCSELDEMNPLTGNKTCPYPSQPISTGAEIWNQAVPCGKKCEEQQNNSRGYFTCLYCP